MSATSKLDAGASGSDAMVADMTRSDAATAMLPSSQQTPTNTDNSDTSCGAGFCWWSRTSEGCVSAGAPTIADRPGAANAMGEAGSDGADVLLGWSELHFDARNALSASPDAAAASSATQDLGLDLDGICTHSASCSSDRRVSCKATSDQTPYDGQQCRDNSLAAILTVAERLPEVGPRFGLTQATLNCGLHRGSYNMLTRIRRYNGEADDPDVRVDWYASGGLEQLPDWNCDPDKPDLLDSYPQWRASATWSIDSHGVDATASAKPGQLPDSQLFDDHAYVREGYLVSRLPDGAQLRLAGDGQPFYGLSLVVHEGLWIGKLHKGQDNTWKMSDGMTAGRVTTGDVMQTFRRSGFCAGSGLATWYQSISTYVSENADVLANGKNDSMVACDALSFGLGFTADQVTAGGLLELPAALECCMPGSGIKDCGQMCGDGQRNADEACDIAIAQGQPGACPTHCDSDDPCKRVLLMGEGCSAHCVEQRVTELKAGDNCCPMGADASKDADCSAQCGNGIVETGETCDPMQSCGECKSDDPCLLSQVTGSAQTCTAECMWTAIATCSHDDKCCPQGCSLDNDNDCAPQCGDGKVDAAAGETCEPTSATPCPTSCDDHEPCTLDVQTGSAQNCNVRCSHMPITKRQAGDACCPPGANAQTDSDCMPRCGNGVLEANETCDDGNTKSGDGCDAMCKTEPSQDSCAMLVPWNDDCARCVCTECNSETRACYGGKVSEDNKLCGDVVECIRKARCQGADCYCGADLFRCTIGMPSGACRKQVEAASRTTNATVVSARANDTSYPIGRASQLGECTWSRCADACGL